MYSQCHPFGHGGMDAHFIARKLRFNNWPVSPLPLAGLHAHRTCETLSYMPSDISRFMSMLQSPLGFPSGLALVLEVFTLDLSCL